jgi:hypothetical protein
MSFGSVDSRVGAGAIPAGSIRQPTHSIPPNCTCSWVVVRPGPGMECLSDLRYRNSLCLVRHTPSPATTGTLFRAS